MTNGTLTVHKLDSRGDWLKHRSTGIGASESSTVLGLNPYKSRYALWCEKTGLVEQPDLSDNEAVEWGTILEEPIARKYVKVTGRMIEYPGPYVVHRHEDHNWMLCTLDRIVLAAEGKDGAGVLEIKTAGARHAEEWDEDAPVGYQCQLQHQLAVMGYSWGSLAVLIGGQRFRYIDYARNDAFISYLIEKEKEFWNLVLRGDPPEVDASESTKEALAKLYPRHSEGKTIALPTDAFEWAEKRRELKAKVKSLYDEINLLENRIKASIGDAESGLLPDGSGFLFKTQKKAAYTVAASETRILREIKPDRR